jgi:hypothetical protein
LRQPLDYDFSKTKKRKKMDRPAWTCSQCGGIHSGSPFSFAADYPDPYANLNRDQREARAVISSDQCIIDQDQFYIRGCFEIPIHESDEVFLYGAWVRVYEHVFDEIDEFWEVEGREARIGPYKGRLANELKIYPDTFNLRLEIRIQKVGKRPLFFSEDADCRLTVDQLFGITLRQAREYSCQLQVQK